MNSDLSEYVSRWARWRLVCACVKELVRRKEAKMVKNCASVTGVFAGRVGVSKRTVQRWLGNGVQSCNVNAERIVELAVELCPGEAMLILEEDLARHDVSLTRVLKPRQGAVAASLEVA